MQLEQVRCLAKATAHKKDGPNRVAGWGHAGVLMRSPNMQCLPNASDSFSTPPRSFLGHCEAMPTEGRFPPPWSVEPRPYLMV
jgi:hypothetical protein